MSMLIRYRRAGGFASLVELIEQCGPKKRGHLLELIKKEDPAWHSLILRKLLTYETVFSWDGPVLLEVTSQLSPQVLGVLYHAISEEQRHKLLEQTMTRAQADDFQLMCEGLNPSEEQKMCANMALVKKVRELDRRKVLCLSKVAPDYILEDPSPRDLQTSAGVALVACHRADERRALAQALVDKGLHVVDVENGHRALQEVDKALSLKVVIADILMQKMTGTDLLFEIREHERHGRVPVVLLNSPETPANFVNTAKTLGVDQIVSKPVDLDQLLKVIQEFEEAPPLSLAL